jgi:hypothetical protein
MVFIRPTILRDRYDAAFQTNSKYNYIRELQRAIAADRVRLMRDESHPELPELPQMPLPDEGAEPAVESEDDGGQSR